MNTQLPIAKIPIVKIQNKAYAYNKTCVRFKNTDADNITGWKWLTLRMYVQNAFFFYTTVSMATV